MNLSGKNKLIFILTGLFSFLIFNMAHASVVINEIMYDLEGSDTGREWIEIYNDSNASTDLSSWKFFEANTNHGLTISEGSASIPAGGYAIIADDPEKFLADWPSFSGSVFNSSFSLANTGETISLKDETLTTVDEVTYSGDNGAAGDGKSLQKINGSWTASAPTPGLVNQQTAENNDSNNENSADEADDTGSLSYGTDSSAQVVDSKIALKIIAKNIAAAGVSHVFNSAGTGRFKEALTTGRFAWNFGDGATAERFTNEKVEHIYETPGDYVVFLEYYYTELSAEPAVLERFLLKVISSDISISSFDRMNQSTELHNASSAELNLSGWTLASKTKVFIIPKNTFILPGKKITFLSKITGFTSEDNGPISLFFPSGQPASYFNNSSEIKEHPVKISMTEDRNKNLAKVPVQPAPEKQESPVMAQGLSAAIVQGVPEAENNSTNYLFFGGLAGLLALSGGAVYFIRRNRIPNNLNGGSDFTILDE